MAGSDAPITSLLHRISTDRAAFDELIARTHDDLLAIAAGLMSHQSQDHSLRATGLLHEAVIRLLGAQPGKWPDRKHFFAYVARAMRTILVDHARARNRRKHAQSAARNAVPAQPGCTNDESPDIESLENALNKLATFDARGAALVELRFFCGFTLPEAAKILDLPTRTAEREWATLRAWMRQELRGDA
jgi:RNA polymerase sigma-70 factor, ECF subfamily